MSDYSWCFQRRQEGPVPGPDRMAYIAGKSFRCGCGCNVFRSPPAEPSVFVCNSCSLRWIWCARTDDIKHPRHPHPMQPIVRATDGVIRFQSNKIVEFIAGILCTERCGGALVTEDGKRITYNDLMSMPWTDEDRDHWNQLIGYSVSGLPWRSRKRRQEADRSAERVAREHPRVRRRR